MHKIFSYPTVITEKYLDVFEHMNNAAYLVLFEESRWDFMNKGGYGLQKIQETQLGPTILELKMRFLKELRLQDAITIESQVISYQKKIGKLSQKMIRHGHVCCESEFIIGLFNLMERKLVLPTAEWLSAIGV